MTGRNEKPEGKGEEVEVEGTPDEEELARYRHALSAAQTPVQIECLAKTFADPTPHTALGRAITGFAGPSAIERAAMGLVDAARPFEKIGSMERAAMALERSVTGLQAMGSLTLAHGLSAFESMGVLAQPVGSLHAFESLERFTQFQGIMKSANAAAELFRPTEKLSEIQRLIGGFESVASKFELPEYPYLSSWLRDQARFSDFMEPNLRSNFAEQIGNAALPVASTLLSEMIDSPSALLCGLDLGGQFGASFTWRDKVEPVLSTALWQRTTTAQPKTQVIQVTCRVVCLLCEGPLAVAERVESLSEYELVYEVAVVPVCTECTRKMNEDPGYLREALSRIASGRPRLKCIPGEGEGDGTPRGDMRLVEDDDLET